MTKGRKVRLNERGIRIHLKSGGAPVRAHVVDWTTRTGTIVRLTRSGNVLVKWDGNKSASDEIPASILEEVA